MSTFIRTWEEFKRVSKLQGVEPTYEKYQEVMALVDSLLKTPEEERYVQVDLNETWKEYHAKYPEKTLDEFIQSRK